MPHRIRILLVDDEPDYIATMAYRLALQPPGFRVIGAGRLREAVDLLASLRVDAILLDLGLPDSHGIETVRRMVPHAGSAPIVVLSGAVTPELRSEAVRAGAQDAILKTDITPEGLARVLVTALDRVRAGASQIEAAVLARLLWCIDTLRASSAASEATIRRADRLLSRGDD